MKGIWEDNMLQKVSFARTSGTKLFCQTEMFSDTSTQMAKTVQWN